jgi:hypothetical protein
MLSNFELIKFQCKYICSYNIKGFYNIRWIDENIELSVTENEFDTVVKMIVSMDYEDFYIFWLKHTPGMFDTSK